ncbi:ABC transporter ATP-binding protein [Chloroflexota bacterium]
MNEIVHEEAWTIEVRGLTKSFGERPALRGINLQVKQGDHIVIFGPNGAGKTTLVKALSTLIKPSSGSIMLEGIDIRSKSVQVRHRLGLVSHQTFLYDDLTVYENLKFYGRMYDVPDLEARIQELVAWLQVESRLHDRAGTLSHGLQQRVSIARAVLHSPSIMFLDEPEVGLDPHASSAIRDVLDGVGTGSRTIVMTTHNLERGLELGDKIVILDKGKIVYQASRGEVDASNFQQVYSRYTETASE